MALTGYQPAPNGGYHFERDDGSPMYLYGPEADNLARMIDATKPADARLAAHGTGTFGTPKALRVPAGAPYDPANPFGGLPDFMPPPQAPAAPEPAAGGPVQPPSGELPTMGGEAGAPAPITEEPGMKEAYRAQIVKAAMRGKYHPGSAAVNPAELAASGVPVPVSETVSGAIPETPEEHQARIERQSAMREERTASLSEYKAAQAERVAAAEENRTAALNQTISADNERRDAETHLAAVQTVWDRKWNELQGNYQAAQNLQVDPNRLFHGKNGAATAIGSAIFMGLGAFGSSLSRGPNYAQQIIQGAIDRDIASQVDSVHRKGEGARNAIVDFAKTYGLTLEESKLAVKSAQQKYAAGLMQMQAAKLGTAEAKAQAAAGYMALMDKAAADDATLQELYKGRVARQFAVVQPRKASAGYFEEPSIESLGKGVSALATSQKAFPGAGGKGEGEVVPNLTRAATAVETGLRALPELQKLSEDAGVSGQVVDKIAGFGAPTELTTAAQHMAYSVASAEVNGMVPDHDRVKELEDLFAAKNPITRKRNIEMGADILRKKKQSIEHVSSKTAKIGSIAVPVDGGGEE